MKWDYLVRNLSTLWLILFEYYLEGTLHTDFFSQNKLRKKNIEIAIIKNDFFFSLDAKTEEKLNSSSVDGLPQSLF